MRPNEKKETFLTSSPPIFSFQRPAVQNLLELFKDPCCGGEQKAARLYPVEMNRKCLQHHVWMTVYANQSFHIVFSITDVCCSVL